MTSRNANTSIKGYYYQFFYSIIDIMNADESSEITIEGIEDLDIESAEEKQLIQYKYHENETYKDSGVGKPIRIMFKHFIQNEDESINYKLFIYLNEENLPSLDKEKLKKILKLKPKGEVDTINDENYFKIDDEKLLNKFLKKFEWKLTQKFQEIENNIINLLQEKLNIAEDESRIIYLPNALKIINDLAVKSEESERKISSKILCDKLNNLKTTLYTSYIINTKGFKELKTIIENKKKNLGIKKDQSDYIIYIKEEKIKNIPQLIINLSKKFLFENNSIDIKAPTFIIDSDKEKYIELKKEISKSIAELRELIIFNDGGEDYHFNEMIFNRKPLIKPNQGKKKVLKCEYNFKILHNDTFLQYKNRILYCNESFYFLGVENNLYVGEQKKKISFNKLNNEEIIEIIGG